MRLLVSSGAHRAPPAPPVPCPVCASPLRRRIELRLFQGAAADVHAHFESGHVAADAGLLIASLLAVLAESAQGARASADASLPSINQSHKLRLEAIKLIAGIGSQPGSRTAPQFVSQTINMLLSDEQAGEMRKLAGRQRGLSARH